MNWLPVPSLAGIAKMISRANTRKVESVVGEHAAQNPSGADAVTTERAAEPTSGTVAGESAPVKGVPAATPPASLKVNKPGSAHGVTRAR